MKPQFDPDLLAYLQNETELTRSTLVRILKESGQLEEFFKNPQRFMDAVAAILKHELHHLLVDGIKYERIARGWVRTRSGRCCSSRTKSWSTT